MSTVILLQKINPGFTECNLQVDMNSRDLQLDTVLYCACLAPDELPITQNFKLFLIFCSLCDFYLLDVNFYIFEGSLHSGLTIYIYSLYLIFIKTYYTELLFKII